MRLLSAGMVLDQLVGITSNTVFHTSIPLYETRKQVRCGTIQSRTNQVPIEEFIDRRKHRLVPGDPGRKLPTEEPPHLYQCVAVLAEPPKS